MITNVIIRRAVEADCDGVIALYAELDAFHRAARPDLFREPDDPARDPASITGLIRGPESVLFVAERERALLGLSLVYARVLEANSVRPERRFADIDSFGLAETARGQGIGRMLMQASERWAREKGLPKLELQVHAFNGVALAFYADAGFTPMMHRLERVLD